ncbi:MAG: sigma 54-interacting transcriptional regulator [Proteobacteria bacterium]|nr:sigma 54-interacting transcriptional regulator [Pseudomonadota bacterium]
MKNVRRYSEKPAEQLAEQEALLIRESIRLLARSFEPARAIREMLHLLSELLGLNRGRVILPDTERGDLAIRYAYGLTREEMRRGRYAPGEGVTGRVMMSGEVLIVQDIDAEPRYLARAVPRATLPQEVVSFIALPVEIDRHIAGVLGVHRIRSRKRALADDIQVLKTIADMIGQVLKLNRLIEERTARLERENRSLKAALESRIQSGGAWGIVGESPLLLEALHQVEQVAASDATVLLLGESGTGKELFARALHLQSPRRDAPFVKVNCAAIPETLFEDELFGHEKGAYTGATQARPGRFEQAHGGTLFLDEIGDLPLQVQVKILRVLQERVIERLGGHKEIAVDVRIVTATHQNLQQLVGAGRFRLDLFYRLNVIPIRLPALRERPTDIKLLVRHFLGQLNQRHQRNVAITPAGLSSLVVYPWPGNIRQLYNVLERVVLLATSDDIGEAEVDYALVTEAQGQPLEVPAGPASPAAAPAAPLRPASVVREYQHVGNDEGERIRLALAQTRGNKSRAAQTLGLTLRQINYRIKVLDLTNC